MEDTKNVESPDTFADHTKIEESRPKRLSVISIILVLLVLGPIIFGGLYLFFNNSNSLSVEKEVFLLSDNSILNFKDNEKYELSYNIMNENVVMKGKYKISYGNNINENIRYEYKKYIDQFLKKEYVLGFLELQSDEIYINDEMVENGFNNTYYILMAYFEDNTLTFTGYNIDTGVKIKFVNQKSELEKIVSKLR